MKNIGILILDFVITGLLLWAGLSGKKFFFIDGARAAVITLGIIGFLFCMTNNGKFIQTAPAHPLTIAGYILGLIGMLVIIAQVFQWQVPILSNPKTALYIIASCIAVKAIIARCFTLIH